MVPAEYVLLLAAVIMPFILLYRQALEFIYAFGQASAAMLGMPW
jgi:hypothetical protein